MVAAATIDNIRKGKEAAKGKVILPRLSQDRVLKDRIEKQKGAASIRQPRAGIAGRDLHRLEN